MKAVTGMHGASVRQSSEFSISNLRVSTSPAGTLLLKTSHGSWTLPLSMMRNGVCIPALWFSPISVSRSHQPDFDGFISRVLNEPKRESEGQHYTPQINNISWQLSKNPKIPASQEVLEKKLRTIHFSLGRSRGITDKNKTKQQQHTHISKNKLPQDFKKSPTPLTREKLSFIYI